MCSRQKSLILPRLCMILSPLTPHEKSFDFYQKIYVLSPNSKPNLYILIRFHNYNYKCPIAMQYPEMIKIQKL